MGKADAPIVCSETAIGGNTQATAVGLLYELKVTNLKNLKLRPKENSDGQSTVERLSGREPVTPGVKVNRTSVSKRMNILH